MWYIGASYSSVEWQKSRRTAILLRKSIGVLLVLSALWYTCWLPGILNKHIWWLSIPFFLSHCFVAFLVCITAFNNWHRSSPHFYPCPDDIIPTVAVLVPTYNEPPDMVRKTLVSILMQRWPEDEMRCWYVGITRSWSSLSVTMDIVQLLNI